MKDTEQWHILAQFNLASVPGSERQALAQVTQAVQGLPLTLAALERLQTAVAEATMNAMEHGNLFDPKLDVSLRVETSGRQLRVSIRDHNSACALPAYVTPNLDAKLAGEQSPRGWGLFLMRHMVDEVREACDAQSHTVELWLRLEVNIQPVKGDE
jgi:anti-sigma regulatory factor (Ser/Thr protein kinase)